MYDGDLYKIIYVHLYNEDSTSNYLIVIGLRAMLIFKSYVILANQGLYHEK